jgi:hypothetical protein
MMLSDKLRKGGAMDRLFILAAAILIAGVFSGGLYSTASMGTYGSIVLNRFTGDAWQCGIGSCVKMAYKTSN